MAASDHPPADLNRPATPDDVRHVLGTVEDSLLVKILSKGPSFAELSDAAIRVRGDGDWIAREQHELSAAALAVAELLAREDEAEVEDNP